MTVMRIGLLLAFIVAGLVSMPLASEAQGRGNGQGRGGAESAERRDRDDRDDDDSRYEDEEIRWEESGRRADRDGRGPPFCRNGEGHPVHGRQWCRDRGFDTGGSLGDIIFGDDRYGEDGSRYEAAHSDFHRQLDRRYSEMASRRPLDLEYQIRLRREKQAEHDRWHDRAGSAHR